jgi:glucose-1-phosphate cytidylyltransferase
MKVVILAGGLGTRISEESQLKPKPMVEIGDAPIIWHIMKTYSYYGFNEFVICCGYKGYVIKEYFANYYRHMSDAITYDFTNGNFMKIHHNIAEPWIVTLVDTGLNTMTGGRVKRIQPYVGDETFMLTYGDGVSDVNINELLAFHKKSGRIATLTAVQPEGRWGTLDLEESTIKGFVEKPKGDNAWINGGFMVFEPKVFDYIEGDSTILEREPIENLARDGQLSAFKHEGFWQPMDTLRDKQALEKLWNEDRAPWKLW